MFSETKSGAISAFFPAGTEEMNGADERDGFHIAAVLAEEEKSNDIDWSTLIISDKINYSKGILVTECWLIQFFFIENYSSKRQKTMVAAVEGDDDDDDF